MMKMMKKMIQHLVMKQLKMKREVIDFQINNLIEII